MSDDAQDIKIAAHSLQRADALVNLGRYQEAITLLARAIGEQPEDSWLHCKLANALYHIDDYDKSLEAAQRRPKQLAEYLKSGPTMASVTSVSAEEVEVVESVRFVTG